MKIFCRDCIHYQMPTQRIVKLAGRIRTFSEGGKCHLHAPKVIIVKGEPSTEYPAVSGSDFCGDGKPQELNSEDIPQGTPRTEL